MTNHSTSVPLDEVEIRADYALKIQEKIRKYMPGLEDFCFNNFHVAILCVVPLSTFQPNGMLSIQQTSHALQSNIEAQLPLVKQCTRDPEVRHIVPFSWTSGQAKIKKTQCVFEASAVLMGSNWTDEWRMSLTNSGAPGGSDCVWNTICISSFLHRCWAQALFGLKCLGIVLKDQDTAIVEVQFHWMPRSAKDPIAPCDLTKENDMSKMIDEVKAFTADGSLLTTPRHGKIGASRVDLSCPLPSGHTFHVEMSPEDAGRFKDMLDFQWACIVVAALSGATEAPHLLPDHPGWWDP